MENISIRKAKLKGGLFLEASYKKDLDDHSSKEITESSNKPVHDDLKNAFKGLNKHLPILCDYQTMKKVKDGVFEEADHESEWVKAFSVTGFSIGGEADHEGVTLTGRKTLENDKIVNLNTPFTKWVDEDYKFAGELSLAISSCIFEVKEYLFNSKCAPEVQLNMFGQCLFKDSILWVRFVSSNSEERGWTCL